MANQSTMKIFIETLVYVIKDNKVLLILKKRGLGEGLYNAPGGKIENNELPEDAAIRELKEEVGLEAKNLEFRGLLEFRELGYKEIHYVYVYVVTEFEGEIKETEEAKPIWFDINKIPYDKMWEDDKFWLPKILSGKKIYGRFIFRKWKMLGGEVYELTN